MPSNIEWESIFLKSGYRANFKTKALIAMDVVDRKKKKTRDKTGKIYIDVTLQEEASRLAKEGLIPSSFSTRTLTRARGENANIMFSIAYSLSVLLELPLKDFVIKLNDEDDENIIAIPAPDLVICMLISSIAVLSVVMTYIAIGLRYDFHISGRVMPVAYALTTSAAGFFMRQQTGYALPMIAKIMFGFMIGITTGALCSFSLNKLSEPEGFDTWIVTLSIILFLAAGVFALRLGQEFAAGYLDEKSVGIADYFSWTSVGATASLIFGVLILSNYDAIYEWFS